MTPLQNCRDKLSQVSGSVVLLVVYGLLGGRLWRVARGGVAGGLYTITGLGEATVYRVKIGARNEFGWSYSDEEFVFGTKGAGEKQH